MRSGRFRRLMPLIAMVLAVGGATTFVGFLLGQRWPASRIERVRRRLLGDRSSPWHQFATADFRRYEMIRVLMGNSLIVMGGFVDLTGTATTRVDALDLRSGAWTRRHDMPVPVTHAIPVVVRDTVWIAGGFEGNSPGPAVARVWRYVPATDTWLAGVPLPEPRGGGALVAVGDTLHFFGGWLPDRNTDSADHWILVIGDTVWRRRAPLPTPRGHLSGAAIGGHVYAIAGAVGHDPLPVDVAEVDRYDGATDSWEPVAAAPFPLSHVEPTTTVYDGRIITMGGRSLGRGHWTIDDILAFNPATNAWSHVGRLPLPLLAPVAVIVNDTTYVGLGAERGSDPRNQKIWKAPLRNTWRRADTMPVPLAEVAGGVIDGKLYLVGSEDGRTLVYDLAAGRWSTAGTESFRPAPGDHHAAEVLNGALWLLGGLGERAEGRVQIFDPVSNTWRLGPALPVPAGSSASAVIGGRIYVAGGVVGDSTTSVASVLDTETMRWTAIAPMPRPRNHAASGTDGRRFYVFGGRRGGNVLGDGFDDVQIYDPATDRWTVSDGRPGSPAKLPQPRGGMGKAVWLDGEFWVIGGETVTGRGATKNHTYNRVDIYDPVRNTWREGPPLPTARHGIFPVAYEGMILVAGGGDHAGASSTNVVEIIWPKKP